MRGARGETPRQEDRENTCCCCSSNCTLFLKPSILQQPKLNLFQPSNSALLHQYENLLDGEQKSRCWTVKEAGRVVEGQGRLVHQPCHSATTSVTGQQVSLLDPSDFVACAWA